MLPAFNTARAKVAHLAHEGGPAIGALLDGIEDALSAFVGNLHAQELDGHQDGREHVVQVMGNAAGEGADAVHALGAQVLVEDFFVFGDVRHAADHAEGATVGIAWMMWPRSCTTAKVSSLRR